MTEFTGVEQEDGLSWDEAVARYLEANPDYFERHPQVLQALSIPHPESGRAVSLIERQVQHYRESNEVLSDQVRTLVAVARSNDRIGERLHRLALQLIESSTLDAVIDDTLALLRDEFGLEFLGLWYVAGQPDVPRAEFDRVGDEELSATLERVFSQKTLRPLCGQKLAQEVLYILFGESATSVASTALVPLGEGRLDGVLALGSSDDDRFTPTMGTTYLAKLGELLHSGVRRHLRTG